jgi:hypothetical protein
MPRRVKTVIPTRATLRHDFHLPDAGSVFNFWVDGVPKRAEPIPYLQAYPGAPLTPAPKGLVRVYSSSEQFGLVASPDMSLREGEGYKNPLPFEPRKVYHGPGSNIHQSTATYEDGRLTLTNVSHAPSNVAERIIDLIYRRASQLTLHADPFLENVTRVDYRVRTRLFGIWRTSQKASFVPGPPPPPTDWERAWPALDIGMSDDVLRLKRRL